MLSGKAAVITGSTSGIGFGIAEALCAQGCRIMLNGFAERDQIEGKLNSLREKYGVKVAYNAADLRMPEENKGLVEATVDKLGSIDILINNAAVRHFGPIDTFKTEEWDESLAVNLSSPFHMTRAALPHMRATNWGRIVNMSSAFGFFGAPNRIDYVTTKTAIIGFTRAAALEVAKTGITCNALCPGTTLTPPIEARIVDLMQAKSLTRDQAVTLFMEGRSPAGRFIEMDSIAAMVVFLCSPGGKDINGAALPIDLGWTAGR